MLVATLIAIVLLAASPNIVSAQKENQICVEVLPRTRDALRGESYIVNVSISSKIPAIISLDFSVSENGVKISRLNNTENVVLNSGDVKVFMFNLIIEETAAGNITVKFILKNNITADIVKDHKIKVLLARHAHFNLTKKLANQEINITIYCGDSKYLSNVDKTDKNGLFLVNKEIPAFKDNSCNLTAVLKTEYGSFLVNEIIRAEIENLLNATIYPRFLINATLNTLTLEGMNLKAKNLFAKIVADNSTYLNLSETKSILLGVPERGKEKVVDLFIGINVSKGEKVYLLNSSHIKINKEENNLKIYLNGKHIPLINKNDVIINITTPLTNTTFSLYYLDKSGFAKLSSGVMKLIEVEVPLAYNSSEGLFSGPMRIQPNASIITVREYNNTAAKVNITIEFAGEKVLCKSVNLSNNTRFRCDGIESSIFFKEGETVIVVNTTSRPIRGRVRFDDLTRRVLFLGTIEVSGVPKSASGTLKVGSFNVTFKCVGKPSDGYACEGSVYFGH